MTYEDVIVLGSGIEGQLIASLLPGCTLVECFLEETSVYSPVELEAGDEGRVWHKRNSYTTPIYKDRAFKLSSYLNLWRKSGWGKADNLYGERMAKLYCRNSLEDFQGMSTRYRVPGRRERLGMLRRSKKPADVTLNSCFQNQNVDFRHADALDSVIIHSVPEERYYKVWLKDKLVEARSIVNTLRLDSFFKHQFFGSDGSDYLKTSRAQIVHVPGGLPSGLPGDLIRKIDYEEIIDFDYRTIRVEHDGSDHTVYMLLFSDEDCIADGKEIAREIGWLGSTGMFGELYSHSAPDCKKVIDYVPYLYNIEYEGIECVLNNLEDVSIYSLGMWGRWDDTMSDIDMINSEAQRIKSLIDNKQKG